MKLTKIEQKWLLISFILFLSLFLILVVTFLIYLLPSILKIEDSKSVALGLKSDIENIEKKWLSFSDFKKLSAQSTKDKFTLEILKVMDEDFYKNNLVNNSWSTYENFIKNKKEEIEELSVWEYSEQQELIWIILPTYSSEVSWLDSNVLSDFEFINYVESILETFNLKTNNSIWINKLDIIEDYSVWSLAWEWIESNMYYIPLNLILEGKKSWIIDFLYFIENVWNISLNWDKVEINISDYLKNVSLEWDLLTSWYNILKHQMVDIDKLSMDKYIDSWYDLRPDLYDFKDLIKSEQWNEKFTVNVILKFYVKGFPLIEIENMINDSLTLYQEALSWVWQKLKTVEKSSLDYKKLLSQQETLKWLQKEVVDIKKSLWDKEKIDLSYRRSVELSNVVEPILNSIK